jgi:hypothetical protein
MTTATKAEGLSLGAAVALSLALLAAAGLGGCTDTTKLNNLCVDDSECPANFACIEGRCRCKSSASCENNEVCNAAGFCQARVGCETSLDCPAGQFCDRTTGQCLDREHCTADVQCELGQVCDPVRFECVAGCRDVGDCALGAVCICASGKSKCGDDAPVCGADSEKCELGQCKVGPCGDSSYCKYGQSCVEDGPGGAKRCVKDERGPFCDPCTIAPGQNYCPGDLANFCLVDTSKQYGSYFCGVECASDTECPWGFGCDDVLILTQDTCGSSGQGGGCRARADLPCESDTDCPGGECDLTLKQCRAICVGNEGDVQGFCTCLSNGDCPADECDTLGRCSISRKSCDVNHPCSQIFCKNGSDPLTHKTFGYCFIGKNCAPVEGVSCDTVRGQ